MISEKMAGLGKKRSVIRELFEYGKQRAAEIGAENVFDFSLGNPNVPAPAIVNETLIRLLQTKDSVSLHGYTSAPGDLSVRAAIADYLNDKFHTDFTAQQLYLTVGAAASLTISLNAIAEPEDEVIVLAPFFPEYRVFIEKAGMKTVVVPCREEDFQLDVSLLRKAVNAHTKAIIVNSPNNPSGVVLREAAVREMCTMLSECENEYGHPIFLIADEPYRELVYGDVEVPYLPNFYKDTIVCYSFSKSLSLPGERIGYILVSNQMEQWQEVYSAVCGAGRALGFVCAPALFQYLIPSCLGAVSDLSVYQKNRDLLCNALTEYGFHAAKPDGAFYLFVKALEPDANAFSERAKKHELLLVPSDDFGFPGYVRISYCVSTEKIERALPAFRALAEEYAAKQ